MLATLCLSIALQTAPPQLRTPHEIVWATAETSHGQKALALDLRWPAKARGALPVVLVVDPSGAGTTRERAHEATVEALLAQGVAVASTAIRTSDEAEFPAQVHDLKAAIRFLRAQQEALRVNAARIVMVGSSAGGHLAALTGMTNRHQELERVTNPVYDRRPPQTAVPQAFASTRGVR